MSELSQHPSTVATRRYRVRHPERWTEMQDRYRATKRKPCRGCGASCLEGRGQSPYCSPECLVKTKREKDKIVRIQQRAALDAFKIKLGCSRCGYNQCGAALDFHHKDSNKERRITVRSWATRLGQMEIDKCVLLCANCHREEHHTIEEIVVLEKPC